MSLPSSPRKLFRHLVALSTPIIGLNVLNVLALAVDTAMCGRLPDAEIALTGLGFASQISWLLMVAMLGVTVGSVAMVARAYGAAEHDRVNHVLAQSMMLTIYVSLGVAVFGNLVAEDLLRLLGASDAVMASALDYLRPMLMGTIFSYTNLLLAAVLRGVGNTRLAFFVALLSNALNVVLNYGLILGNWGLPALGVQGAAIGTVCSQAVAVVVLIVMVRRGTVAHVKVPLTLSKLDRPLSKQLIRIGAPASLDMVILNASFLSIIGMLGRIDEVAVAAHGIGLRIQALAFVPGMSISQATGALVGQALGEESEAKARSVLQASLVLCTAVMSALAVLIILAVDPIVAIFDVQPGTPLGDYSVMWIELLGYCMPIVGMYIAFVGLLQGAGATGTSLRINFLATVMFQIPMSYVLGFTLGWGAFGVWVAFPLSFLVKAALGLGAYRRASWVKLGV